MLLLNIHLAALGNLNVRVGEDELADHGVEGESVDTVAHREHKDG